MSILLEHMTILEAAEIIKEKANKIAKERNITEQEAWSLLMQEIKTQLGG